MIQPVYISIFGPPRADGLSSLQHCYQTERDDDGPPLYRHTSFCLVCPFCLNLWAIIRVGTGGPVMAHPASCEDCPGLPVYAPIPGSLFRSWLDSEGNWIIDGGLLTSLPAPLIEREFRLHLEHSGNL